MAEITYRVPETINFSKEEESVLQYWQKIDVFKNCLKQSKSKPRYSFYDGPPFATGMPHYGHILAGTIKDVVTRYAHQQGFHVERRFGWDCHGLPVEYEIDKTLGIKGPDDVMKMGIDKYNAECRKIVMRYSKEWKEVVNRMGRWIDFENDYKTMYPWYMESIWWVFKELFNKGFVYEGIKVMPYSTACSTPLSNFESGQNYKEVVDPAVVVNFPIIGDPDKAAFLSWTTTPWTLPSNVALCVNPNMQYVKVKDLKNNRVYILAECRLQQVFKSAEEYTVLEKFLGKSLKGIKYQPMFDYFAHLEAQGAFQVLNDDYVTDDAGTGIVHNAPYFGEDDYRVCLNAGIIRRDQQPICPVDASGRFTQPVSDFVGQYVKDADKNIIKNLQTRGRLVHSSQVKHSYPFCWRSDTPLIYKAVPSWFIRVEDISADLLRSSEQTYWVPEFVRDKRFGNWLREARDWAVSRNRYWGTPIPLWMSEDRSEVVCVGSIAELERLTGAKVTDLHRESIDHLEIPSQRPGGRPLRRVSEVFDCWFESGSMPYAQQHFPFENARQFWESFPADFIGEGIDQTRGWFYTLIVVSTALFGRAPFRNLIANGLVLASDGQKMSKRKKNYPDPMEVVNKYGADALRLYLVNSPVVRAENLRFKEDGVRDVIKDVFLPWFNAFRFLMQSIEVYEQEFKCTFRFNEDASLDPNNIMDRWILSFTESLLAFVRQEMLAYRLYTVVPRLAKFVDHLTNWYVRMNRKRLKGENGFEDTTKALNTLFSIIYTMVRMMAPFTPFLTEYMYGYLKKLLANAEQDSVHYLMMPKENSAYVDKQIERSVARMQSVIELGRIIRDRKTLPIKYPLSEIIIIHQDSEYLNDILSLEKYVLSELNVRKLSTTSDKARYGITLRAEPDHKALGEKLRGAYKEVAAAIKNMTDREIENMVKQGSATIAGNVIDITEVRLIFKVDSLDPKAAGKYEAHSDNDVLILLDCVPDEALLEEGTAREVINRVQKLRKKAHLVPTDEVTVYCCVAGDLKRIVESFKDFIENTIKAKLVVVTAKPTNLKNVIIEEEQQLKGSNLCLLLTGIASSQQLSGEWVNLQLCDLKPRYTKGGNKATVKVTTCEQLKKDVDTIFGLYGLKTELFCDGAKISTEQQLRNVLGKTIAVVGEGKHPANVQNAQKPFCDFTVSKDGRYLFKENPIGELLS